MTFKKKKKMIFNNNKLSQEDKYIISVLQSANGIPVNEEMLLFLLDPATHNAIKLLHRGQKQAIIIQSDGLFRLRRDILKMPRNERADARYLEYLIKRWGFICDNIAKKNYECALQIFSQYKPHFQKLFNPSLNRSLSFSEITNHIKKPACEAFCFCFGNDATLNLFNTAINSGQFAHNSIEYEIYFDLLNSCLVNNSKNGF